MYMYASSPLLIGEFLNMTIFSKVRNDLSENVFVPVILAKKIDVSFDFLSVK